MVVKIVEAKGNVSILLLGALLQGTFLVILVYAAVIYYFWPTAVNVPDFSIVFFVALLTLFLHEYSHIRAALNLFGDKVCKIMITASIFYAKVTPLMRKGETVDSSLKKYGILAGPVVSCVFVLLPLGVLVLVSNVFIEHPSIRRVILLSFLNVVVLTGFATVPFSLFGYISDTKQIIVEYKEQGKRLGMKKWLQLAHDSFYVTLKKDYIPRRNAG